MRIYGTAYCSSKRAAQINASQSKKPTTTSRSVKVIRIVKRATKK